MARVPENGYCVFADCLAKQLKGLLFRRVQLTVEPRALSSKYHGLLSV
jgi:hypothetical protein